MKTPTKSAPAEKKIYDKLISSRDNVVFTSLRDCLQSRGIAKHAQFIIAGERAVRDTLVNHAPSVLQILVPTSLPSSLLEETRAFTRSNAVRVQVISLTSELFNELDVNGTRRPLLVAATPEVKAFNLGMPPEGVEVLCALQDPSNVGALLRSCAAFNISRVVLLKESASPFHPKAVRAASAATLTVPLAAGPSLREAAEQCAGTPYTFALDMLGSPITKFQWPKNLRLILGEEGRGVPKTAGLSLLSIPIAEGTESLNATVATSIALYSYRCMHGLNKT